MTWSYNPDGPWTSRHQMTVNGKRDGFSVEDLEAVGRAASLPRGRARAILRDVVDVVAAWPRFAADAGVEPERAAAVARTHRPGWDKTSSAM